MALTPEEEKELRELEADPALKDAADDDLASMISPDHDPVPQVLATLPATNHAAGDAGAEAAWMRKPAGNPGGSVFVYEPTLSAVQKRLMEDPQFNAAIFPSRPRTPDDIARLTNKDSDTQAAKAKMWQETADAATKAGKVAYRYSFTPWLQGAKEMGALQMLKGALNPATEGVQSFVMGVDDTALFGAVRAEQGSKEGTVMGPADALGIEHAGGVQPQSITGYNAEVQAEHPIAYGAGQVAGFLNPVSLGGKVFSLLGKAGQALAPKALGVAGRIALGGVSAGAAAGAHKALSEGVDAASNYTRTGDPGTTLPEAAARVQESATDPLNVGLGAGGEALGQLTGALGRGIAGSRRFGGRIGRIEELGGEVKFGKGPTAPGADEAIAAGKKRDVSPDQPIAERIAPEVEAAVKQREESTKLAIKEAKNQFYQTREGQMRLPVTQTLEETKRVILQPQGRPGTQGKLEVVDPQSRARDVKANRTFFNSQVAGVSLKPVDGAVELTAEEADAILTPLWKRKLIPETVYTPPKAGASGAKVPDAREAGTVPPPGKAKRAAGPVAAKPTREADTVRMQEPPEGPGKDAYGRATADYRQSQKRDNERAADLGEEFGIPDASSTPDFAKTLGKRKVYVVPKRYTAEEHEELIRGRQVLSEDPQKPGARDAKTIYQAAFRDRDARPGGWSALQNKHKEMLDAVEQERQLVSPGRDALSAQEQLSKYARQSAGELPRVNAIQDVGKRAGVGDELRLLRILDPLGALKDLGGLHKPAHAAPPTTLYGALSSGAEALTLRGLYPGLKSLGGETSPIRSGKAARAGMVDLRGTHLDDDKEQNP